MDIDVSRILHHPIIASYVFNTAGSIADIISTALLHRHNGNPDELNQNLQQAMNEKGPARGGCLGEVYRRFGFGILTIGLLGVDKFIVPQFSETPLHLTETVLVGMGFIYFGAAFLNTISVLSTPENTRGI